MQLLYKVISEVELTETSLLTKVPGMVGYFKFDNDIFDGLQEFDWDQIWGLAGCEKPPPKKNSNNKKNRNASGD